MKTATTSLGFGRKTPPRVAAMIGQRWHGWYIVDYAGKDGKNPCVWAVCVECEKVLRVRADNILFGQSRQCSSCANKQARRKVINLDTRVIYRSIHEAARKEPVSRKALQLALSRDRALKNYGRVNRIRFAFLDDLGNAERVQP